MSRRSSTPSLSTPSASLPPCVFSCRIVSIESYTCPPSKDLDICYSDFRSCPVEKVPVIRIFGATPLGQKTCLHIHGVFPYLYVPCMVDDPGAEYLQLVARSIYHALQVSLGPSSRNANHVFRIILTKGKPFYGYHEKNRLFLKIFLYNPALIKRLADLLVAGVVMNQVLQPHEAHIPFILQFMIDHHLFGMNHVHLANVRFRIGGCERASSGRRVSSRSSTPGPTPLSPQSPLSSSFLYNPSQTHWNVDTLPRDKIVCVPRASVCELEVDAIGAEILNRHELSLVSEGYPGLAALWEEEKQRRSGLGMDTSLSPPPSPGRCEDADGYHGTEKRLQEDLAEIIQQRLHPRDATPFDDSVLDPSLNSGSSKDSHLPAMSTVGKETVVVNSQALLQTQSLSQRCSVEAIEQCSDEDIFELLMEFCQSPSYSQPATHPLLSQPSTPSLSSQPSQPPEPPLSSQPSQPPAPLLSSQSFPASSQELNPPHSPQTVGKMLLDSMRRSRSVKSASSLFSSPSPPASQSNRLSVRDPLLTQVPVNSKIDTGDRDELNVEVMDTSATADAAESRVDPASTRHLFPVYATHLSESSLLDESLASDAPNENSLEDSVLASDTGAEEEEEELPNVLVPNSEAVGTAAGQDDQSNFLKPTLTSLIPVARDISTELRNLDSVGPDLERAMVSPLRTPSPKPQEMDDCVSERVSPFDEEVWMEGVGDSLPCAQPQLSALDSRTGALWGAEQEWNQSVAGVLSGFKPEPEGGGVQLEYSISEADMAQFDHSGTSAGPGSMLSGLSQAPGTASEKGDGARESGSHHLTRRCLLKLVLGEESGDEEGVAWSDDSLEEEHAEMTQLVWDDELCSPVSDLKCGQRTGSLRDRPSTVRSDVISQLDGSGDSPPHGGIVATTPGKKRRKRRKTLGMAKKRRTNPSLTKLTVVHGEITPVSGRELHREATPSCRREAPRDITPLSMPMEETPPPATCPEEAKTDPVVHPVQTTQDKEALIVRYATNLISPPNPGKRSLSRLNLASSKRKHKHSLSLRKRQQRTGRIPLLALEKRTCRVSLVKLDLTTLNIPHCRRLQNESGHQQAQNDSASDRQLEPDDWSQARRFESSAQSPDSSQPKTKGRTHQLAVLQNTLQQQRQLSELSSSQQSVCWKRQRQRNASVPPIESSQQCMQTCKSMGRPHKSSVPPTEGPSQYMHALQPRGRLRKSSIPRMEDNKQHIVSWSRSPQQRTRQSGTRRRSKSWIDTSEVVPLLDHDPLAMSTKDDEARLNLALKISAAESELFSPRPKQSAEPFSPAAAIETSSPQAEAELFSPRPEAAAIEMPSSLSGAKLLLEHPSPQSGDSTPPLSPQKLPNTNSDRAIAINTTPPQSEVNLDYSITSIEETPPRTPPLRVNTPPLKSAPPTHVPSSIPRRLFEFNEGLHSRTESLSFKGPYGNTGTAFRHNDKACCNEAVLLSAHGRVHIESPCKELPSDDGTTSEEDMAAMRKNHDDSFSLYFSSCESDTGSEVEGEREISPLNMSEPIKIRQIRYLRSIAAEEKLDMVSIQKREVWTPSVLPLSPQEALESALRYGIPPAVHVKPYYSNPADVQSARCVGGRILKVSSMMPYELNEFEAPYLDADTKPFSLLGLHQLNSVESLLPPCHNANKHNQFGDYVQAINARSRLFSDGGVVITPAAPPPCPAKLAGSVQPGDSDATPSRADHSPAQDLTTSVAQCKGTPQHCGPNPRNIGATLVSTSDKATPIPEFGQELAPLESGQTTPTAELEEDIATSVPGLAHSTPMKKEPCVAEDKGGDLEVKGGLLLNMSLLKRETSQLEGPTPANSFGFKVSQSALQRSHDLHEVQHLTSLSVELHVHTRGSFKPDPELDPVLAIFYFIHCDWPLPDGGAGPNTRLGIIAINKSYDLFSGRGNTTHTKSAAEAMPTGESALVAATATPTGKSLMPGTGSVTPTKESCDPTPEYCGGYLGGCGLPAGVMVEYVSSEQELLRSLVQLVREEDPDFLIGYEVVMSSWGYLIDRAAALNVNLINEISRVPKPSDVPLQKKEPTLVSPSRKPFDLRVPGRIVLNVWSLMRHEIALNVYTFENLCFHVLHKRLPHFSHQTLTAWYSHRDKLSRYKVLEYYLERCTSAFGLLDSLNIIGRTSEFARLYGIEFENVANRGSQYKVESMMLRLAKPASFIAVSPSVQQRTRMAAPECIPLVLEPESKFYEDPVLVLDFQSLYPSMVLAYNYCYSTCLGRFRSLAEHQNFKFGTNSLYIPTRVLKRVKDDIHVSPNGVAFVKKSVRKGIVPTMLEEILGTRIMVKNSMKKHKGDKLLERLLNARQLALKLVANTTFGYMAASYSGRMPCIEIADSIVQKGRETLERAIQLVNSTPKWGGRVVYGDTDSLFVQLKGATKEQAFRIGKEISERVTADNPSPVKLKFEKVYLPCILEAKKRYVGYSYESPEQKEPIFDDKGIETVRRDSCPAVGKVLAKSLHLLFKTRDVSLVKSYVQRQFRKLMDGKVNIQDFTFAKEYRGREFYRPGASVPALELTKASLAVDRRSEPRRKERVPYVIVCGIPGQALIQLVRRPRDVMEQEGLRLNANYYITKQLIPTLERAFSLMGVDVREWYSEMPKVLRASARIVDSHKARGTLGQYFASQHCPICEGLTLDGVCKDCQGDPRKVALTLLQKARADERTMAEILQICTNCVGTRCSDHAEQCDSIDCPVLHRRFRARQDHNYSSSLLKLIDKCLT